MGAGVVGAVGGQTIKSQRQQSCAIPRAATGTFVRCHTAECAVHGFAPMLTNGSGVGFDFHQRTDQWGRRSHDRKPRKRVGERLSCADEQMVPPRDVCSFMCEYCSKEPRCRVDLSIRRSQLQARGAQRYCRRRAQKPGARAVTRTVHTPRMRSNPRCCWCSSRRVREKLNRWTCLAPPR